MESRIRASTSRPLSIQAREVLTRQQIARYDRLRGYTNGRAAVHSGHGAQHQQHDG